MGSPLDLIDLGGRRRTPLILQSEAGECGLACLAMVCGHFGFRTDLLSLRRRFSQSLKGTTLKQLLEAAEGLGLIARPLRGELEDLEHLSLPAILHWDLNHYVVLTRISRRPSGVRYEVHDPAVGRRTLSLDDVSKHWTGVALELLRGETFVAAVDSQPMAIRQLWSSVTGLWEGLRNLLILSLILQLAALAAPFYLQTAIDTAYPAGDKSLLYVLALGFGAVAIIEFATGWLRSLVLVHINNTLAYQIVVNLFRHLVGLPLSWFERRHVGDVISRFGSTLPITQLVGNGMVATFIDGVMALLTFVLMVVYSPVLAAVGFGALIIYVGLRLVSYHSVRLQNVNSITASALEQTAFIESVRGIAAIKAFGQEGNRLRLWQLRKADAVNAAIKLGRLGACFDALVGLVTALERVVFVYLAMSFAFEGKMTIGMIFAFQAYKQQFLDSGIRVVGQAINLSIIRVHMTRISDIALAPPEDARNSVIVRPEQVSGSIVLESVGFTYGMGEAPVLRDVSLQIQPGEMVALVGPSGGGKTTLLKLMMGLYDPVVGRISVDGLPLSAMSKRAYRSCVGSIAQSDMLFSGSIAENIALFAPDMDLDRIQEVARLAHIHDEIQRMPLGYDSFVGDMGSILSGGQKQRVLLARALYGGPKILFMDEGTANLDQGSESVVLAALRALKITRVVIAHRPKAIEAADKIYLVDGGTVCAVDRDRLVA